MYNEILNSINGLPRIVKPVSVGKSTLKHSDGLSETYQTHNYGDSVNSISKKIAISGLSLSQRLELNAALVNHFPV